MPMMQFIFKVVTATCSCISATGLPAAISEEAAAVLCLETNWSNLKIATEDLETIEALVTGQVAAEINQLKECDPRVALWQKRVAMQLKEEVTEEEYNKLDTCNSLCTPNLSHRYRLGKRIAEKLKDLNELVNEGRKFRDFGWKPLEDPVEPRPKARTFGMESVMAQLHEYFDNKEKSIIGIWGQGGVGKTTLLNMFNNELKERSGEFNVVIWIDVSNYQRLNVVNIQRMITDRLGLEWNDQDEADRRARVLAKNLRKKNFVILLDDVWEAFRLEEVGIPEPGADKKCKIVLASRDKHVCVEMGARKSLIEMPLLDDQAAWELFRNNLTANDLTAIDDSPDGENVIGGYAVDIAGNCGRLPLALKVIGSAVAGLKDPKEWCDAVGATKAGLEDIDGVDKMFLRLKYSYDRLNLDLKECFLYCTLFPGNSWIKKDQLVDYWVAEGVIPNDRPAKGRSNIRLLASACLLQYNDSQSEVKLHHIIRQLGLWLTTEQGKFLVKSGMDLKDAPDEAERWREAKRISLMSNDIRDIKIIPECKYLQTLLLQNNPNLAKLSPKFFRSMSSLRVLDLSYTAITELPECDALVELAHLNLNHTRIVRLPENFYILNQLMHLDLSVTSALENTSDNCSKLLELRVLNLFRSNYGIRDVNDLNIDSLEKLEFLGIAIHAQDVLAKLKKKHPLARSTHRLSLKHCRGMESIQISELKKMVHLEELYIESCNDLKELIADADEQRASCLQVLTLAVLPNLDTVSVGKVSHYFQLLRDITIDNCHKLYNVTWVLQLKSLERLEISHCDGMIQVVREMQNEIQEVEDGANEVMHCREFPKLKSIVLNSLNLLESICGVREFSCLESIRVEGCPKLKRLPVSQNYKMLKLKQICGSDEWWKQLIWEEETMRKKADEYFIQISEAELENRY